MIKFTRLYLLTIFSAALWFTPQSAQSQLVRSIELRNYILQPGMREKFTRFMNQYIVPRQEELGGYLINEFCLKGADDNFVWIRGFTDMQTRSKFMKDFYYSTYWKQHRDATNSMLVDSYDVYLLKPVIITKDGIVDTTQAITIRELKEPKGIAVVNYYLTNNNRDKLISLFASRYRPLLRKTGIDHTTLWISETVPNDYTSQHVFLDINLLVTISYHDSEKEYQAKMENVKALIGDPLKKEMKEIITSLNTKILYLIQQ